GHLGEMSILDLQSPGGTFRMAQHVTLYCRHLFASIPSFSDQPHPRLAATRSAAAIATQEINVRAVGFSGRVPGLSYDAPTGLKTGIRRGWFWAPKKHHAKAAPVRLPRVFCLRALPVER